jgi:uncharacterized protein YaaQ
LEKLLLAIMPQPDSGQALDALTREGYRATVISSTGGFLRKGSATLLIGVDESKVDHVVETIRTTCMELRHGEGASQDEAPHCGVTIFTLKVNQFEHI